MNRFTRMTCLFALALSAPVFAQSATQPATQPADPRIAQLVAQLGADDFASREQAFDELKKLGPAAAPALKEAAKSDDAEVKTRAEKLLNDMDGRHQRRIADLPAQPGRPGVVTYSTSIRVVNGNKEVDVKEPGRKIHISDGADGLVMTVTEERDGKEITDEYKAKNADDLKQRDPDAFDIYQKYAGKGGIGAGNMIQLQIGGGAQIGGQLQPVDPDQIRRDIQRQLKAQGVPVPDDADPVAPAPAPAPATQPAE